MQHAVMATEFVSKAFITEGKLLGYEIRRNLFLIMSDYGSRVTDLCVLKIRFDELIAIIRDQLSV